MNFRITTFFFALLLTSLWVFGLMVAHRKATGNRTFVVPSLQGDDIKIDKVVIKSKAAKGETVFENINDRWYLKDDKQQVRVEGHRVKSMIDQIKDAKQDETADVSKATLSEPDYTITLSGKAKEEPKEWKFYVGKENLGVVYVGSSDQEGKVFAVNKRSVENLMIIDPNQLRSKRLFDFGETSVTGILVKKDGKELELKRGENSMWTFVKPALGFAGFDVEAPPEKKDPHDFKALPPAQATSGVKALLNSIINIRVEDEKDFEPLGSPVARYGLEPGKESMKIEITSAAEKGEKKESNNEVMLIGAQVKDRRDGTYYYARLLEDDGVFQINGRLLAPIEKAVADPGKIRSLDIAFFEEPKVDAIVLQHGKVDYQLFKSESMVKEEGLPFAMPKKAWEMIVGKEKKKVNESAVHALLEQVQGKKAIVDFLDVAAGGDEKKKDAEWGFDAPSASVAVYVNGIEKKDEKKDDKDKKDEKDKKDDKDKKDEAKKDDKSKKDELPTLKKDAKAAVKLEFGKVEKDTVNVKRTLQDGTVSRFTVKKEYYDKLIPSEGVELAFLDTDLPLLPADSVTSLKLERRTDKGMEAIDLERRPGEFRQLWYVKDSLEPGGYKQAETNLVDSLVEDLAKMHVKKWLKKLDDKEDLAKYGLKSPVATLTITVRKTEAASAVSLFAADTPILAMAMIVASRQADKKEIVTLTLGKETDNDKDKPGNFAMRSDSKMLFLVPAKLAKDARDRDFRDRAILMAAQAKQITSYFGAIAGQPINALLLLSPHVSGDLLHLDPDKVKEVKLEVRDRFELRTFDFVRDAKDKAWTDKSNIPEFRVDPDKVNQFVKDIAKLHTDRFVAFVGGPRGEHKLGAKEAMLKLDLTLDDGKTVTLLVGTNYQNQGFYATLSTMPEAVFMLPMSAIEPVLRGAAGFAKERVAAN